jgi:predicted nucleic acid-binding protein
MDKTRIYLDVSCLNRPFDDQSQVRIRLEAEAIVLILERLDVGVWRQVSSGIAVIEIDAIADEERRVNVRRFLPEPEDVHPLSKTTFERAQQLEKLGFKAADAVHVAAAEECRAEVLLSCDDRLCKLAKRHEKRLRVAVANPLTWLQEQKHA